MTRSLQAIRCLCGSEPVCPFHAPRITGESKIDRIFRESREYAKKKCSGASCEPGTTDYSRYCRIAAAESTRRLKDAGLLGEIGLATAESIAMQRATVEAARKLPVVKPAVVRINHSSYANPAPPKPRPISPGYMLVVVPHRNAQGVFRDSIEAAKDFAHEPWAAEARYLGTRGGYDDSMFLFERPDPRQQRRLREQTQAALQRPDGDVLAAIRQYQTEPDE